MLTTGLLAKATPRDRAPECPATPLGSEDNPRHHRRPVGKHDGPGRRTTGREHPAPDPSDAPSGEPEVPRPQEETAGQRETTSPRSILTNQRPAAQERSAQGQEDKDAEAAKTQQNAVGDIGLLGEAEDARAKERGQWRICDAPVTDVVSALRAAGSEKNTSAARHEDAGRPLRGNSRTRGRRRTEQEYCT